MDFGLQGKTVLVTASSQGLGYATAKAFAGEGAKVMLSSRSEERIAQAARQIQEETGNQNVSYCVSDVTRPADIEDLFARTESLFGGVDVLINNTGGPPAGTFDKVSEDQWQAAFELCLMNIIRCTRRALPHMRKNQWGRIVNFASSSIKQPLDNLILSNTFRAGIVGLSKSMAIEFAPDNILVNVLGPGRIATQRVAQLDEIRANTLGTSVEEVRKQTEQGIPLGRYGAPDEFASTALYLGSAANGYLTGQSILVDGGLVRAL
ncbi:SDR family oxidoreductase [Alicyclobacillus cycloheptanicus]|uniref:3-oxoacyl-[acyl-carrier protein] reductase n=1 Tax=Alicyclobacillus cycloheptanicus TaxID=1457 RepID=A0ABT9XHZ7_9BACL|nr:SDR family oxidoreductase [Alicyclobacillus cycloheptanicus]MDQ0189331.1 3-oxoacyl-[acyl-carrier protein] reductase [Alicyclobacillus cycloheptanicus]WDM01311.1 SDR family oxidoreductase [Alicyclobacillus cycloheptanicus]